MKILVVSQYWSPENGVPQRRWTWLSKSLIEAGHEIAVVAPPAHYERAISPAEWFRDMVAQEASIAEVGASGERIVRTSYLPTGKSLTARIANQAYVAIASFLAIAFRRGFLGKFDADIVIGTVPALPTAVVTRFASMRFGVPYIVDLRDAWPELLEKPEQWNRATGKKSLRERIFSYGPLQIVTEATRVAIDDALRHASGIVLTSSRLMDQFATRSELADRNGQVPPMAVVRNVFPPETQYDHVPSQGKTQGGRTLNVLYAGTLGRAQNLNNAIEAVDIARAAGVNVFLRLVGAGATKQELMRIAREKNLPVSVESRRAADSLELDYQWADTALVHLSNWAPLERAVPSKTYELMECGIHISGVVAGETADLIQRLDAGHVVEPDNPWALADLWISLSTNRTLLDVSSCGRDWVRNERKESAKNLHSLLERVISRD